jgi:hypothetical protein
VEHYRAAHKIRTANRTGDADTEQLRVAVVHYRWLFDALLMDESETAATDEDETLATAASKHAAPADEPRARTDNQRAMTDETGTTADEPRAAVDEQHTH